MRRFFIEEQKIKEGKATLRGSDAKHIRSVLRMKPDDAIVLFDGKGTAYSAKIVRISTESIDVSISRQYSTRTESPVSITLAQAFLKEKKMDRLVRQMTELGITRWAPFFAERSVSRPDRDRLSSRQDRWHKIAREASKQCGRGKLPEFVTPMGFDDAVALGSDSDLAIVFWENATQSIQNMRFHHDGDHPKQIFLMMGPEGGFSEKEVDRAGDAGFLIASLGPRILRAETATIAACSLMQYLFGDLG
jgi:16S rRNA (uracil1498-N3)-methyltransferase